MMPRRLLSIFGAAAFALLTAALPTPAQAPVQTLYVAVSPADPAGPAAVVVYDVGQRGTLTARALHETGGDARGLSAPTGMAIDPRRRLLFVANYESSDISVFRIQSDGDLAAVPGSPFPTDARPVFLAIQPPGDRLFVVQDNGVRGYRISATGSLSMGSLAFNPAARDLRIGSAGRDLYVADIQAGVRAYRISPAGELTEQPESPYRVTNDGVQGRPIYMELIDDRSLVALDVDAGFGVWNRDRYGDLDVVEGAPFAVGEFSGPFGMTADGGYAYVNIPFEAEIRGFRRGDDGKMTPLPGSPFASDYEAAALVVPPGLPFLYEVSAALQRINLYMIDQNGGLTARGTYPVGTDRRPNGAAYYRGRRPVPGGPDLPQLPGLRKPGKSRLGVRTDGR